MSHSVLQPRPLRAAVEAVEALTTLQTRSRRLDGDSVVEWDDFLSSLQEVCDLHHPNQIDIHPKIISFVNPTDRTTVSSLYDTTTWSNVADLRSWVHGDAKRGHIASIAVLRTMAETSIGKTREEWAKSIWHAWVIMTIHPP
ncbi:hypothetical protein MVEN_00003000 [Mycena venus]|uniref:Uncharacterized protein n=1 Tax=Mycena venus TaxID=2733690 RepID=A0A8H7DDI2_9AGAR|nr:hypothetical protein MVEN_00003000 [Mycena venus]